MTNKFVHVFVCLFVFAFVSPLDGSSFFVVFVPGAGRDSIPSIHVHSKRLCL